MEEKLNPKITIIIPVYNGSNFIKQAIESAITQTYTNIEIIVINDGSTDNGKTAEIIKSFGDKIKYIEKENGGVASALNRGIKEATGEYISWLSHDDIYLPNKIEKEIEALNTLENKNTIIFSNFELINEKGEIFAKTDYTKNIKKEKLCQGIYPVVKGCVNGCTILIPKDCFEDVGYFKQELKTTNDYEMWIRLFSKFPSYFIEEILIQYRIHQNQDTNKSPVYIKESNELWKNIINSLTETQIEKWGFDKFNVYMMLYIQMKNSNFAEASELAYNKAKQIYQEQEPVISIGMPCYNSEKYIEKAIESILEQTYCNYELLIVDDSSTDNTAKKIKAYAEKDFRIKILKNEYGKGVSGAMNTAIENARGIYFTRMDSDDISVLDRLEKQQKFLDNNEEYGICSVNISMLDKFGNIYNENIYPEQKIPSEWTFLWTNPVPNAPCMYKMSIINDNNIRFSDLETAEDYEFLREIITKTKIHMINEPLYLYRHNETSIFNSNLKETFKNSLEITKRYYEEITKNKIPEFYKFLTYFYTEDDEPIIIEASEIYIFLLQTAETLSEFYKWNEDQYNNVKMDILNIIEKYAVYKYLVSKYGKIGSDFGLKQEKQQSSIIKLIKRGRKYLKKHGVKKTILKIIKK